MDSNFPHLVERLKPNSPSVHYYQGTPSPSDSGLCHPWHPWAVGPGQPPNTSQPGSSHPHFQLRLLRRSLNRQDRNFQWTVQWVMTKDIIIVKIWGTKTIWKLANYFFRCGRCCSQVGKLYFVCWIYQQEYLPILYLNSCIGVPPFYCDAFIFMILFFKKEKQIFFNSYSYFVLRALFETHLKIGSTGNNFFLSKFRKCWIPKKL